MRIKRKSRKGNFKRPRVGGRPPMSVIRKANRKRKRSSLELIVHAWLKEDGIAFKIEKAIGRCHVDVFIEPNLCLEVQGCYWHNCSICIKKPTTQQKVASLRDTRRFRFLRSKNMVVISIWEHDIVGNPEVIRKMIRGLCGRKD